MTRLPTTTHHVGFTIGTVDWVAEVEVDETGWTLKCVMLDLGGNKYVGCFQDDDLDYHIGIHEYAPGERVQMRMRTLAEMAIKDDIDALMEAHAAEVGQNEIDSRADHRRESRDD